MLHVVLIASVASATAQRGRRGTPDLKDACSEFAPLEFEAGEEHRAIRIIEDFATGTKWLIQRNSLRPGNPGQMIPVPGECYGSAAQTERQGKQESRRSSQPIIHAGDSVIVIEETPSLDASYEGVALSAAQSGEPVNIRLKIGGRALQGIAIARGRARLVAKAIETH
jgi:hypothetical protein